MPLNLPNTDILLYLALSEEFYDLSNELINEIGIELHPVELDNLAAIVYCGKVFSRDSKRDYQVTIVPAGKMGITRAAALVSPLIGMTKARNVVVLGIAGAISDDLQPGDVFIPDVVNEYLANSAAVGTDGTWTLQTSGNHYSTTQRLLSRFQSLPIAKESLYKKWLKNCNARFDPLVKGENKRNLENAGINLRQMVKLFVGDDKRLASGPAVGKGLSFTKWIKNDADRKIAAMEMESSGIYDAAKIQVPEPRVIAIRGISDFADERKKLIEDAAKDQFRSVSLKNALGLLICSIEAGVFEEESRKNQSQDNNNYTVTKKEILETPCISLPTAATDDFSNIVDKLDRSCKLSKAIAEQIDKSLSDRDFERFNRLRHDQADESSRIEGNILRYIECYLNTRPKGELSRFKIKFTDSRALFGVNKLHEWVAQGKYIARLDQLSRVAANLFKNEGLITRAFIIPSFTELSIDPAFSRLLMDVLNNHLHASVQVSLVTIRLLDTLGFDAVNFCIFEGGHLMKLDVGHTSILNIYDESYAQRFNELHEDIRHDKKGIITFSNVTDLTSNYENKLLEQTLLEGMSATDIITIPETKIGEQYNEEVARWWGDPRWDEERRACEAAFLLEWLTRCMGSKKEPVLDAACGTGTHSFILAEQGYPVKGCDASWHQIERARTLAKQRQKIDFTPQPQNPFFRTLTWHELPNYYDSVFGAVLCLGGSLIHVPSTELRSVAFAFCQILKKPGYILIDHRNIVFFRNPQNCSTQHAGHDRKIDIDFTENRVIFNMTDNCNNVSIIEGIIHPITEIIDAFSSVGAELIFNYNDHGFSENHVLPEWYHLTFKVQ